MAEFQRGRHRESIPPFGSPACIADARRAFAAAAFAEHRVARRAARPASPSSLVLGPSCAGPRADAVEQLIAARPEVGAILIADELSTELLQRALRAGVQGRAAGAGRRPAQLRRRVARVADTLALTCDGRRRSRSPTAGGELGQRHHGLLHQGRRGQVGHRHQPGGRAGPPPRAAGRARRRRPAVRRRRRDAQARAAAHDRRRGRRDRPARRAAPAEPARRHEPSGLLVLPAPLEPAFADQIGAAEMVQHRRDAARRSALRGRRHAGLLQRRRARPHRDQRRRRCSSRAWTSRTSRTSRSGCRPCGCSTRRWRS